VQKNKQKVQRKRDYQGTELEKHRIQGREKKRKENRKTHCRLPLDTREDWVQEGLDTLEQRGQVGGDTGTARWCCARRECSPGQ
ncbi:hypothetical protein NDU88_007972, partial [Pleurodeles waltl]